MGYNLQLGLVFSLIIIIIIIIKTTSPCLINSVKGAFCFYHQSLPMVLQAACDGDCCFFFFVVVNRFNNIEVYQKKIKNK